MPERLRDMVLDAHVAVNDHREGRGLHAAHGQAAMISEGVGAGGVHTHQPVGLGARVGRVAQPLVVGFRPHRIPCGTDRVLVQRRDPQTVRRLSDAGMQHDSHALTSSSTSSRDARATRSR